MLDIMRLGAVTCAVAFTCKEVMAIVFDTSSFWFYETHVATTFATNFAKHETHGYLVSKWEQQRQTDRGD